MKIPVIGCPSFRAHRQELGAQAAEEGHVLAIDLHVLILCCVQKVKKGDDSLPFASLRAGRKWRVRSSYAKNSRAMRSAALLQAPDLCGAMA